MDTGQKEIFSFQIQRNFAALSKNFLTILEDLATEYDRYFDRSGLDSGLTEPPENFLNDDHFGHLRKRILDRAGDAMREVLQELDKYELRLLTNEELQDEARKQR